MPLNVKIFDAQIRFVLTSEMKDQLFREAKRRAMSAADLLRLYIEQGLEDSGPKRFVKTEAPARDLRTGSQTSQEMFSFTKAPRKAPKRPRS
jgi:hypothetical protein